jgi:hypothetical protein
MKYFIFFTLMLLPLVACDTVGDIFDPSEAPEIKSFFVNRDNVLPLDTVTAVVVAENPESGLLSYRWYHSGGRFIEPSDKDTVQWIAPTKGGTYKLEVKVSNSEKSKSENKLIHVNSLDAPVVDILTPQKNEWFILNKTISVSAIAVHDNDLLWVRLMVINDKGHIFVIDTSSYNSEGRYQFNFEGTEEMVGTPTLKVEAKANSPKDLRGSDELQIKIGGALPGEPYE